MSEIWKYPIPQHLLMKTGPISLNLPLGAVVLTVQMQGNTPHIWALVDPGVRKTRRKFLIQGTGRGFEVGDGMIYYGTFLKDGGSVVGHVFGVPCPACWDEGVVVTKESTPWADEIKSDCPKCAVEE